MDQAVRVTLLLLVCWLAGACAVAPPYSLVGPGETKAGSLRVTMDRSWNQASDRLMPNARDESVMWTQDGILLDRLVVIPDVGDGETLFEGEDREALPPFRSDMLPNEIAELVESSISKLFGEGQVVVETSRLRPQRFGEHRGVTFELDVKVADGPDYGGISGGFVAEGRLQVLIFLGAEPYYAEKHQDLARRVIVSARV